MKKRNKPIFLVTFLIFCVALVFGVNYVTGQQPDPDKPPPAPKTDMKAVGQPRPIENTSSVAKDVQNMMPKPKGPPGAPGGPGGPGPMPKSIPTMVAPTMNKPQPSDSGISTQWYSNETHSGH